MITNIAGLGSWLGPYGTAPKASLAPPSPMTRDAEDTVEVSPRGRALARGAGSSSFVLARIRAVRMEIAQGTYETPERIDGTAARLLDVIG